MKKYSDFNIMDAEVADQMHYISEYAHVLTMLERDSIISRIRIARMEHIAATLNEFIGCKEGHPSLVEVQYYEPDSSIVLKLEDRATVVVNIDLQEVKIKGIHNISASNNIDITTLNGVIDWIDDVLQEKIVLGKYLDVDEEPTAYKEEPITYPSKED